MTRSLTPYYDFALRSIEKGETIYEGRFSDLGIEENDELLAGKLGVFFGEELGIYPDEWEIGQRKEKKMKYYLDIYDTALNTYYDFALRSIEERETIYEGRFSDIGIEDDDDDFANKLDVFFSEELGISPDEWEIG
jgi:hypothetical protein